MKFKPGDTAWYTPISIEKSTKEKTVREFKGIARIIKYVGKSRYLVKRDGNIRKSTIKTSNLKAPTSVEIAQWRIENER